MGCTDDPAVRCTVLRVWKDGRFVLIPDRGAPCHPDLVLELKLTPQQVRSFHEQIGTCWPLRAHGADRKAVDEYEITRALRIAAVAKRAEEFAEEVDSAAVRSMLEREADFGERTTYPALSVAENDQINADAAGAWRYTVGLVFQRRALEMEREAESFARAAVAYA